MNQITAHPDILGGKPIIAGTRISVEHILGVLATITHESDVKLRGKGHL